jgi:prepilin peptidase CpaA
LETLAAYWIAFLATALAAAWDLRVRRIPNWLTLGTLAAGFALNTGRAGVAGLLLAAGGVLAAGFPALVLFRLRAMGGGDVKLLAACGSLLGPSPGVELFLASAVVGGGMALATIVVRRAWAVTRDNLRDLLVHWRSRGLVPCPAVSLGKSRGIVLPYGLAIAGGMVFTLASHLGKL